MMFRFFRREDRSGMQVLFFLALLLMAGVLPGCAGLSIPAPDAIVNPAPQPLVPESTIALPITFSASAVMKSLGLTQLGGNDPARDKRIAGMIRGFFQRQALKKESLVQSAFLREQISRAWDALRSPIPLRNGWSLLLQPRAVTLSALSEEDEAVHLVVQLMGRPVLVAGAASVPSDQPLPEISIADAPADKDFHLSLQTEFPFDRLGQELTAKLKGRSFTTSGKTFLVEKARVYGSGGSLVVAATLTGDIRGTLYLVGKPRYDPAAQSFSLDDLDYTIETREVLVAAADWIMHSDLRESMAKKAVWHAGDSIDQTKADLTKALNRPLNNQVSIRGMITRVEPVAVYLTRTGLAAMLEAEGNVEMHLL